MDVAMRKPAPRAFAGNLKLVCSTGKVHQLRKQADSTWDLKAFVCKRHMFSHFTGPNQSRGCTQLPVGTEMQPAQGSGGGPGCFEEDDAS